ncbi:MAG: D-alanyl-D-alanine carboxypeptidase [Saprospirales bacterium]|nr:D-alanyl-D-alanine carboxypeptidase [Saprospirales bacterium]
MNTKWWLFALIALVAFAPDAFGQKRKKRRGKAAVETVAKFDLHLERNPVFKKAFTGFALYDPDKGKMLYEYNSDKYFTPASNTKILTLFTALSILQDSVPALKWSRQGDLTIIWGTGDPSFLNPHLQQNPAVFEFLKNAPGYLLFCPANYRDQRYGSGWMWSDYPYYYQAEKSPFPVYSNVAHFSLDSLTGEIQVMPAFLKNNLAEGLTFDEEEPVTREEFSNAFVFNPDAIKGDQFEAHVPFHFSPEFFVKMLSDTLHRPVGVLNANMMPPPDAATIYSLHVDSLYRLMMQESDNFIAEQMLLLCSNQVFGEMNTRKMIHYVKDRLFLDLPDEPQWVDGSGLSRYNLFTPRSVVAVLDKIRRIVPQDRLLGIFPAGGVSGTIEDWYGNGIQPYVFAKTGTLRNNHCLSGYLLTRSGRLLIFSFMHNNYTGSSTAYKREMEKVLRKIRIEVQ